MCLVPGGSTHLCAFPPFNLDGDVLTLFVLNNLKVFPPQQPKKNIFESHEPFFVDVPYSLDVRSDKPLELPGKYHFFFLE